MRLRVCVFLLVLLLLTDTVECGRRRSKKSSTGKKKDSGPVKQRDRPDASVAPDVESQIIFGENLYSAGHIKDAQKHFNRLARKFPDDPRIDFWIGFCALHFSDEDKALHHLRRYVEREKSPHTLACNKLGRLYEKRGDIDAAIEMQKLAVNAEPTNAAAVFDLARVIDSKGNPTEAAALYDSLIEQWPTLAMPYNNKALVHHRAREFDLAMPLFNKALELAPDSAMYRINRGVCHHDGGDLDRAYADLHEAYNMESEYQYQAAYNLGRVLVDMKRLHEAASLFIEALRLVPDSTLAVKELSQVYMLLGDPNAAAALIESKIGNAPDDAELHVRYGNALRISTLPDRLRRAITEYERAIELNKSHASALHNAANIYFEMGQFAKAVTYYKRAHALRPNDVQILSMLTFSLKFVAGWEDGALASATFASELERSLPYLAAGGREQRDIESIQPFSILTFDISDVTKGVITKAHADAASRRAIAAARGREPYTLPTELDPGGVLNVGYVSSDFHTHPVAHLLLGVLEGHDRHAVRVHCYSLGTPGRTDHMRTAVKAACDEWADVGSDSTLELADRIHADGIHALVNLNGWTAGNRNEVFALRPAPLQLWYLGYVGPSYADYIDYIVTDDFLSSGTDKGGITEAGLYMPGSFQVNNHKQVHTSVVPVGEMSDHERNEMRIELGLPPVGEGVVFACFSQVWKIDEGMFRAWLEVLNSVPDSVLWLLENPTNEALANLLRFANKHGGIGSDRLVFTAFTSTPEYFRRARAADLFLDTRVYNAGTMAADMLWAGVPILTLSGNTLATRMCGSFLHALELPQLVTTSLEDYKRVAVELAQSPERLVEIQKHLAAVRGTNSFFDTARWITHFERGLKTMWGKYARGLPLTDIYMS